MRRKYKDKTNLQVFVVGNYLALFFVFLGLLFLGRLYQNAIVWLLLALFWLIFVKSFGSFHNLWALRPLSVYNDMLNLLRIALCFPKNLADKAQNLIFGRKTTLREICLRAVAGLFLLLKQIYRVFGSIVQIIKQHHSLMLENLLKRRRVILVFSSKTLVRAELVVIWLLFLLYFLLILSQSYSAHGK